MSPIAWILISVGIALILGTITILRWNRLLEKLKDWEKKRQKKRASTLPSQTSDTPKAPTREMEIAFLTVNLILFTVEIIALLVTGSAKSSELDTSKISWSWGWFYFFLHILWFLKSFDTVKNDEIGAIEFFGKLLKNVPSGPVFVPWPFFKVIREKKLVMQIEFPNEPEKVWKGDDDKIEAGFVPPIRITHADYKTAMYFDEKVGVDVDPPQIPSLTLDELDKRTGTAKAAYESDPLHGRLVSEVSGYVRLRVNDLVRFKGMTESIEDAAHQIQDTVVAALQDIVALLTPAHANANKMRISSLLRRRVEVMVGEKAKPGETDGDRRKRAWGISVEDVDVKLFDWRKRVNTSIADANAAGFLKRKRITDSEGVKEEKINHGKGDAGAAREVFAANAAGVRMLSEEIAQGSGELAARLQTMERVASESEFMVLPNDSIFGTGMGIAEAIQQRRKTETPDKSVPSPSVPPSTPTTPPKK